MEGELGLVELEGVLEGKFLVLLEGKEEYEWERGRRRNQREGNWLAAVLGPVGVEGGGGKGAAEAGTGALKRALWWELDDLELGL